jgi:hypothetical protein
MADEKKPIPSLAPVGHGLGLDTSEMTPEQLAELNKHLADLAGPTKMSPDTLRYLADAVQKGVADPNVAMSLANAMRHAAEDSERKRAAAESNGVDNLAAAKWFDDHWPYPRVCTTCAKQEFWVMSPVFAHIPLSLLGRHAPVRSFPAVVITCRNCGNSLFFNAVVMQLLEAGAE